jgi:hypothetical protein
MTTSKKHLYVRTGLQSRPAWVGNISRTVLESRPHMY